MVPIRSAASYHGILGASSALLARPAGWDHPRLDGFKGRGARAQSWCLACSSSTRMVHSTQAWPHDDDRYFALTLSVKVSTFLGED